jgi:IS605 OrfB family transposase
VYAAATHYERRLRAEFSHAADALCDYLSLFGNPVVVVEDLTYELQALSARLKGRSNASAWLLPTFHDVFRAKCRDRGFDVKFVDPDGTSRECHLCGRDGEKTADGRHLRCPRPSCSAGEVCRDRSAAVSIAKRIGRD